MLNVYHLLLFLVFYLTPLVWTSKSNNTSKCVCGLTFVNRRIWNSRLASSHQYPWMVSIKNRYELGSGVIVHQLWVLTTCTLVVALEKHGMILIFGTNDQYDFRNVRLARDIICHENWKEENFDNDIALIKVNQSFIFNHMVMPICIPSLHLNFPQIMETAGWGMTEDEFQSKELRYTVLQLRNEQHCEAWWEEIFDPINKFCAGVDSSPCYGDSGSPIVSRRLGFYFLEGIFVIAHERCNFPALPAVFMKVRSYLDWIKKNMKNDTFCQPLEHS